MLTSTKEEIVSPTAVSIFPNPVNTTSQIKLDNDWRGKVTVTIVNIFGQTVQNHTITKYADAVEWNMNTQDLQSGTYQIILSNGHQLTSKPFIVVK